MNLLSETAEAQLIDKIQSIVQAALAANKPSNSLEKIEDEKDFYSTKDLIARGWSAKEIDYYVSTGELHRIECAGKRGHKYPVSQVKNLIKKYYVHNSHTSG